MRLALLKKALPGLRHHLAHLVGSAVDHSPYSHSNLVFSNRMSASAWARTGVGMRAIDYDRQPGYWDFFELPERLAPLAHKWFRFNYRMPYDYCGAMRFGLSLLPESRNRFFCHEAIAGALGWSEPWRYGPGLLLARCQDQLGAEQVDTPWTETRGTHPAFQKCALR